MNIKTQKPIYKTDVVKVSELPQLTKVDDSAVFVVVSKEGTRKISYKSMYEHIKGEILAELRETNKSVKTDIKKFEQQTKTLIADGEKTVKDLCKSFTTTIKNEQRELSSNVVEKAKDNFDKLAEKFAALTDKIAQYKIFKLKDALDSQQNVLNTTSTELKKLQNLVSTLSNTSASSMSTLKSSCSTLSSELTKIQKTMSKCESDIYETQFSLGLIDQQVDSKLRSKLDAAIFDAKAKELSSLMLMTENNLSTLYSGLSATQNELSALDIKLYGVTVEEKDESGKISEKQIMDGDLTKILKSIESLSSNM